MRSAWLTLLLCALGGCGTAAPTTLKRSISSELKRCLALEASRHPKYSLYTKYRGEQQLGVRYDQSKERERHRVFVCGGRLCDRTGALLDAQINLSKHAHRDGKAIFVIDVQGQLWITFDQKYGRVHHSTLLAGSPVIAAGEMLIDTGELISVSNESGHYRPPPSSLDVADRILALMGVDVSLLEHYAVSARHTRAQLRRRALPAPTTAQLREACLLKNPLRKPVSAEVHKRSL